jgi:hypothetical protein
LHRVHFDEQAAPVLVVEKVPAVQVVHIREEPPELRDPPLQSTHAVDPAYWPSTHGTQPEDVITPAHVEHDADPALEL